MTWLICSAQVIVVLQLGTFKRGSWIEFFRIWRCPSTFLEWICCLLQSSDVVLLSDWLDGNKSSSERFCLCCQCLQAVHAFPATAAATHQNITHVQPLHPGPLGYHEFYSNGSSLWPFLLISLIRQNVTNRFRSLRQKKRRTSNISSQFFFLSAFINS